MDPHYRTTISNQKERPKKRSNVHEDVSRFDEEEREFKRNRISPNNSGQSMYPRTPAGLYQQPMTVLDNTQRMHDPYGGNLSMTGNPQHYTAVAPPTSHAQQTTQDRQRQYQKLVSGLGRSILAPQPFQEESDSSGDGDGDSDEAKVQEENTGYRPSPLFVNSSDSTRVSQANSLDGPQYSHRATRISISDDTSGIDSDDQHSLFAQTRDASFDQNDRYDVPTREELPPTMRRRHEGANNQPQPATSHRLRFNLPNTVETQYASHHEKERDPREVLRENSRPAHRQEPAIHSASSVTKQQPRPSHKYANYQSPPSGVSSTPIGDTRPRKPLKAEGYVAPKNILKTAKPRKSNTENARSGRFEENLMYPAHVVASASPTHNPPVTSFTPAAHIAPSALISPIIPINSASRPTARYHASPPASSSGPTTSSSSHELISKIPEEQLLRFVPDRLDSLVWGYRHRKPPLNWSQIQEILDLTGTTYVLETVKSRQKIYEASRKLKEQERVIEVAKPVEEFPKPITNELSAPPAPTRPALPAPAVLADTRRIADTLEQERLHWAAKEAEYQERVKALEAESAARTAELREQEKQLKLKVEVEQKYHKLKEDAQTQKENLKDEKALRVKAERDLKAAQSDISRRSLAAAGAARNKGKATDTGFTFSNDGDEAEDEDLQKKTPKRSKSRKPNPSSNPREDGHPRTAGKSLPPAAIQALYKHLNKCKDEDEVDEADEPAETIQEEELSYFVYTVFRKQWLVDQEEPDDDTKIGCGDYTYLNEANAAVTNEVLRPHGNASAIKIDPSQERTLHQGMGEHNMSWAQLDVPAGYVRVWVERQLHTEFQGELPLFENKGILNKTVFAIRQETSAAASNSTTSNPTTTVQEEDEIYTTFELANIKANDKVSKMLWPEEVEGSARKTTLAAVKAKEEARQQRKQRVEDLEEQGQLFTEEIDKEDGTKVKIFVVQKTVTGPRN